MIGRGLLCGALLLAGPTLYAGTPATGARMGFPEPLAEQAAAPPDTQSETKSDDAPEQSSTSVSQAESTASDNTPDAPQQPAQMDCAPAASAHALVGKYGCVSGRVDRIVFTRKGNVRLYLCPKDKCPFHATVYAEDADKVGSLLHLRGRLVAIDGDVGLFHGVPEIKVTDRDQISAVAGGSEVDVAPPGAVKQERKRQVPTEKAQ